MDASYHGEPLADSPETSSQAGADPPDPRHAGADRPDPRHALGREGEQIAARHLERRGFAILARNHRIGHGEIDLVAFDGRLLAFVEVKARTARRRRAPQAAGRWVEPLVGPLEALRARQRARLRGLAVAWLAQRPRDVQPQEIRFDAIGILLDEDGELISLEHIEGAW